MEASQVGLSCGQHRRSVLRSPTWRRRRMNPFRDATPRPRCTKCGLRRHRCLCESPPGEKKRREKEQYVPHADPRQSTLTRRAGPRRQLLGWWQPDRRRQADPKGGTTPQRCPASTNLLKTGDKAPQRRLESFKSGEAAQTFKRRHRR
jgi:hypothetical protein